MVLQAFRALHDDCNPECATDVIQKSNCTLTISQTLRAQIVGIDCDKCRSFASDKRRPDFIILFTGGSDTASRWFVLEMKARVGQTGILVQQLQAGADAIQSHPNFRLSSSPSRLTLLILHERRGLKAADYSKMVIRMAGKKFNVLQKRCGASLAELIKLG